MAYAHLKLFGGPLPPVPGEMDFQTNRPAMIAIKTRAFPLQAAEARIGKLERKRKIMDKLKKLREEAGVLKPKTENGITPPTPPRPMNPQQRSVRPLVEATLP